MLPCRRRAVLVFVEETWARLCMSLSTTLRLFIWIHIRSSLVDSVVLVDLLSLHSLKGNHTVENCYLSVARSMCYLVVVWAINNVFPGVYTVEYCRLHPSEYNSALQSVVRMATRAVSFFILLVHLLNSCDDSRIRKLHEVSSFLLPCTTPNDTYFLIQLPCISNAHIVTIWWIIRAEAFHF